MKTKWLKTILVVVIGLVSVAPASAQDEDYFMSSWYNCDLGGNQTTWSIRRYKEGVSWINKMVSTDGYIIFSDGCVEIYCNEMQMHFPAQEYKRIGDKHFCITRAGEDDYFDYIEVVQDDVRDKGMYRFMLAKLDPDGSMQNTHIFICRPKEQVVSTEKGFNASKTKSTGEPIQVRKK